MSASTSTTSHVDVGPNRDGKENTRDAVITSSTKSNSGEIVEGSKKTSSVSVISGGKLRTGGKSLSQMLAEQVEHGEDDKPLDAPDPRFDRSASKMNPRGPPTRGGFSRGRGSGYRHPHPNSSGPRYYDQRSGDYDGGFYPRGRGRGQGTGFNPSRQFKNQPEWANGLSDPSHDSSLNWQQQQMMASNPQHQYPVQQYQQSHRFSGSSRGRGGFSNLRGSAFGGGQRGGGRGRGRGYRNGFNAHQQGFQKPAPVSDYNDSPEWADDLLSGQSSTYVEQDDSLNWQQQSLLQRDETDPFLRLVRGEQELSRE